MSNGRPQLTSEILSNFSYLRGRNAKNSVVAYVEGHADITFWGQILSKYKDKYEFMVLRIRDCENARANGCSQIKKMIDEKNIVLGEKIIVCMDSDYRFVLNDYTEYPFVQSSNYIFETKVHSRESVLIHPEGICDIIKSASGIFNNNIKLDFSDFLNLLGQLFFEYQTVYLFLYKIKNEKHSELQKYLCSTLDYINDEICSLNLDSISIDSILPILDKVSSDVKIFLEQKVKEIGVNEKDLLELKKDILLRIQDKWKIVFFIRGHDIYERLIYKLAAHIWNLVREQEKKERKARNDNEGVAHIYKWGSDIFSSMSNRTDIHDALFFTETIKEMDALFS